ncbi:helix-turn-helix domain-containing protein [Litorivicinus lipolyticus]|uniref:Helix-turn-helix domain-containing protein n=1 Tax=Litorivicinus lipolyticus TaxID=418701 RepID=A0A5Q2Q9Y4_9GAMM|nr:Crp/Fnr family transcriptional regulator [Litorivicinus lipolyticus]QGG80023.1 helix-turn-helix domain-containing protein [Litorivicinus lipolyticus]
MQLPLDPDSRCSHCAMDKHCFHEAAVPEAFKAFISAHQTVDSGQDLFVRDQSDIQVAVVQSGAFKLTQTTPTGDRQIINVALPGDYVGLSRLFQHASPVAATAVSRSRICLLDHERLNDNPRQAIQLLRRELESSRWHQSLGMYEAPARMGQWFLKLADNNERRGLSRQRLTLPLNRTELANYLVMALETVSRTLKKLQTQGLIAVNGKTIDILDETGVRALAYPDPQLIS